MEDYPIRNYQELASAIVKIACADYIDALIVKQRGYVSEQLLKQRLYKHVIAYGKKRYLYRNKKGELQRRTEVQNLRQLERIKDLLNYKKHKELAEYDIRECESFFHSGRFALFMPNTDVNWLINTLRIRAIHHDRIRTGYKSQY